MGELAPPEKSPNENGMYRPRLAAWLKRASQLPGEKSEWLVRADIVVHTIAPWKAGEEMLTDVKPDEWVIYSPPKSVAFGHQARVRDTRKAWTLTHDFLKQQTNFALNHNVRLMCCLPTEHIDAYVVSARIAAARALLGPEMSDEASNPHWDIQSHQLADAINFSLDDEKFPKQAWGPTMLSFSYLFTWKSFDLPSAPNETRDVRSKLGVIVGGRSAFLQPRFVFPAS
jgi:hypothetical protein